MDEQQRGRIRDDLKGFFKGQLRFDDLARALYSTDASIFQIEPLGVACPADEEDVALLVRYAYEQRLPLIARGAGSGVAGQALGSGLIIDLSQNLRRIDDAEGDTVRVQPGVTLERLNQHLAPRGRRFAPGPAAKAVCTLGGMLGNNASGSHALRHGTTADHVVRLRTVLDNGDVADLSRVAWPLAETPASSHLHDLLQSLGVLLEENAGLIAQHPPRTRFDRCGYRLDRILQAGELDLLPLLVGSEGTLGIFTEATLRTVPLPADRALVLLGYGKIDHALGGLARILDADPAACELIDRRILSLVRGNEAANLIPANVEAVLLAEFESAEVGAAQSQARALLETLAHKNGAGLLWTNLAENLQQHQRFWNLRDQTLPGYYGQKGGAQPIPFAEDVAVPLPMLSRYLRELQEILKEFDATASYLIHAGAGQVHARPFLDLHTPEGASKVYPIADRIHTLAIALGGTISTQHAVGLARTPWVSRQCGPDLYPLLRQVKQIFDPHNIFNPGKIVEPDGNQALWPLRRPARKPPEDPELRWQPLQLIAETNHCNGCGVCRSQMPGVRMCPIFHAQDDERNSPRAKANLLRHLTAEDADPKRLGSRDVRLLADRCVNCKMCASECPSRVNIPKMMLELKAQNVAEHGLDWNDWFFARLEKWVRWGSSFRFLANTTLRSPALRWLMARAFNLSSQRRLPLLARHTFMTLAQRRGWTKMPDSQKPKVALFVDLFANYFDPQIPLAAGLVLEHHGYDVHVPPGQQSSGIECLVHGDADGARDLARRNLRVFAELARAGVPIVCLEPHSALALRSDYLDLIDDFDARLVADRTVEFTTFLSELKRQGKWRSDFQTLELSVGHHVPCHLKALNGGIHGPGLLADIPGLKVTTLDVSCSGMAGTFGMRRDSYETSIQAGALMLQALAQPSLQFGATECSSCRIQMEDAGRRRTLHPAQYLAWAYGLLPEVAERLREPIRKRVLG